jgi:hypothetical protein
MPRFVEDTRDILSYFNSLSLLVQLSLSHNIKYVVESRFSSQNIPSGCSTHSHKIG